MPAKGIGPGEFFSELYKGVGGGFIEIRPLFDKTDPRRKTPEEGSYRRWFRLNETKKASDYCLSVSGKIHVYFGVMVRKERGGDAEAIGCGTCLWADVDYKHISKEKAHERLRQIPFEPSIVARSGHGAHIYWLLDEPTYESSFHRVEAVNRALLKAIGAQVGPHDRARILRVPQTVNIKPEYPDPKPLCEISWWHPEKRHSLEAFEKELKEENSLSEPTNQEKLEGSPIPDASEIPASVEVEELGLPVFTKRIIKEGLAAYVEYRKANDPQDRFEKRKAEGKLTRSEADAFVVLALINANVPDAVIHAIYRDPKNKINEKYREQSNGSRYLQHTINKASEFKEKHPRTSASSGAEKVGRSAQRRDPKGVFDVRRVLKIPYENPIYLVESVLTKTHEEHVTRCSEEELDNFKRFKRKFLVQHNRFPPFIDQPSWEHLINTTKFEIRQVDTEVASLDAEIREALSEWLSQAHPELNESVIQYLPAHDEHTDKIYLRIKAFMKYLTGEKIEAKKRDVVEIVKRAGFQIEVKRLGKSVAKFWTRAHGNGHPTSKQGDLFTSEGNLET